MGGDKQRCFCGAPACRGYLGAKKPLDEDAKKGRKEREQQQEMSGRMRVTPFDQLMDVISYPDPPERPRTRVFLLRNAKRGYRKWKRYGLASHDAIFLICNVLYVVCSELREKMPAKAKSSAPEEKEVPLEKAIKMALQAIKMDNPEFNLFD